MALRLPSSSSMSRKEKAMELDEQCKLRFDEIVNWDVEDMCYWLNAVSLSSTEFARYIRQHRAEAGPLHLQVVLPNRQKCCILSGLNGIEFPTFTARLFARDATLLSRCSSVCLSGTGVHCDYTVHFSTDLSL